MNTSSRLVIRVGTDSLSFAVIDGNADNQIVFEPYDMRSGISVAANLREAFANSELLMAGYDKVHVVIDSPVVLVPTAEMPGIDIEGAYNTAISDARNHTVLSQEIPELGATALFAINKDLKLVVDDHFADVRISTLMASVWRYLYHRDSTSIGRQLFAYRHGNLTDVFAFAHGRFRFANTFRTRATADTAYFILAVWDQLGFDSHRDEIHLAGFGDDNDEMRQQLSRFVESVATINPSAEFNRAPITRIKGLPLDMMTLFVKK